VKLSKVCILQTRNDLQTWSANFWSLLPRLSAVIVLLIALVGSASQLEAQSVTSGDIVGLVADPSGAVIPNAQVTLRSDEKAGY